MGAISPSPSGRNKDRTSQLHQCVQWRALMTDFDLTLGIVDR